MDILTTVLEITKYLIPAVIVYILMNRFLNGQQSIEQLKLRLEQKNDTLPMRFQAYERLTLLLERIRIPNLVMRLQTSESSATDLMKAIVISVQKEYEHNLTQQIYVSEELWKIISLTKDSTIQYATELRKEEEDDQVKYIKRLIHANSTTLEPIVANAQNAIKKEVELYFV